MMMPKPMALIITATRTNVIALKDVVVSSMGAA